VNAATSGQTKAGRKNIAAKRNGKGGYTPKRNGLRVRRYPLPQFSTQKPLFRAGGVIVEGRRMDETENYIPAQKEQSPNGHDPRHEAVVNKMVRLAKQAYG